MQDRVKGGTMQYKVQTAVIDNGETLEMLSGWVEAGNLCHAAVVFMLDNLNGDPEREWLDPIMVVDEDYNMGNYKHDAIEVACDHEVGLR